MRRWTITQIESESVMLFLDNVIGAFGKGSVALKSEELNLKKRAEIEDSKNCNAGMRLYE